MKVNILFDAIGKVEDSYIVSAQSRLESSPREKPLRRGVIYRKAVLTAAAILLLLMSSFTIVMAANEEFRHFVFQLFHISTTDNVLPPEAEPDPSVPSGQIEDIGNTGIEDKVSVEYVRFDGICDYKDGIIYSYDESGELLSAYTIENGQLTQLEGCHEAFEYTWNGVVYQISFDWYETDGIVHTSFAGDYDMDTSAAWSVHDLSGNSNLVMVELSYGMQIGSGMYPLLYDISTHEVVDVLSDCEEITSQNIIGASFSPDLSSMLITCGEITYWYDENSSTVYHYDLRDQTLNALNECAGMKVMDAWFIDNDTIGCLWYDADFRYTCRALSVADGESAELFSDMPSAGGPSESGILFTGGRYGLYIEESSDVYVYDFKTGDKALVEDFEYYQDAELIGLNSAGDKMLFFKTAEQADGLGVTRIGVLDLTLHSMALFDREGYEIRRENAIGWFDNDRVAIWAQTEDYGYLYLFNVKDEALR